MAVEGPLLDVISLLAAKVETTTGTAISLDATNADLIVMNLSMQPDHPVNERQVMAGKGQYQSKPGAQSGKCTFEVELMGKGSAGVPSWASIFLPACDWTESGGTFSAANSQVTLTIVSYENGLRREMCGCRGNFRIIARSGQPVRVAFEFTGKYLSSAVTDAAILSPTFPTVLPPVWGATATTCTFASFAPVLSQLELNAGNNVVLRESGSDAGAYRAAVITNRRPSLTADPEATLVATRDWQALLHASTEEALSVVIGSAANNTMTIASSKLQTNKIQRASRNGITVDGVTFQLNSTGPFTLAFA